MGKKLKQIPELKAYHTPRSGVARLLRKVARQDEEIVAVVWRKDERVRPRDPEDGYRHLCALAAKRCVERYSQLSLVLDKRYTNARLRDFSVKTIIGGIGDSAVLALQQSESRREKALQVADAVAWGVFQRYKRGDTEFCDIIREKTVSEEVVGGQKTGLPWELILTARRRSSTDLHRSSRPRTYEPSLSTLQSIWFVLSNRDERSNEIP